MDVSGHGEELRQSVDFGGSRNKLLNLAKNLGPVDPSEEMDVTLLVRRPRDSHFLKNLHIRGSRSPVLSRESFAKVLSSVPEDLNRIKAFADQFNLKVKDRFPEAGTLKLSGKVEDINRAFSIQLEHFEHEDVQFHSHKQPFTLPEELDQVVEAVLGLDTQLRLQPHFHILNDQAGFARSSTKGVPFSPNKVAALYNFPSAASLNNQCIGIIELGGGYNEQDLQSYFSALGIQAPSVKSVSVDGATNSPSGDPNSADGEVVLDIEVAGAVAPGVNIVVYFAPNTDAGFLNAIKTAIHDTVNKPSVVSISWGSSESNWSQQAMQAMDQAFQDAAALGVTICCAAGDQGSSDSVNDGQVHVDFPASSPHVLACGGTKLIAANNKISQESVWDESGSSATGGGVSEQFALPAWQQGFGVPPSANTSGFVGRGVPDVAGDADPQTGYQVLVDGQSIVVGGTSAVAPLWAGLIAILNQELGKPVGFINPTLYNQTLQTNAFNDITQGSNDTSSIRNAYKAKPGWDACTGLGTPNGTNLLNQLENSLSQG